LWDRFSEHDPQEHLWYYRTLHEAFKAKNQTWLVDELERVVGELTTLVARSTNA
jgi:hypothetical protein